MNAKDRTKLDRLIKKVREAFKAYQACTDRARVEALGQAWVDAAVAADNFQLRERNQ